jgi:hypothetical protein
MSEDEAAELLGVYFGYGRPGKGLTGVSFSGFPAVVVSQQIISSYLVHQY